MWKAIGVSAALLVAILVLSTVRNGHSGLDPRDQLMFERQRAEQRQTLLAAAPPQSAGPPAAAPPAAATQAAETPVLACAARRVTDATVEALYLVWINHRQDLADPADTDRAPDDVARSITACGGNPAKEEDQAHRRGLDLEQAAALAMLRAGR